MKNPRTLQQIKDDPRVSFVSDERPADGIWIYLINEWTNPQLECGTIHEHTVKECILWMRYIERK